ARKETYAYAYAFGEKCKDLSQLKRELYQIQGVKPV
ncbi:MAG: hypothetical protein KR126chlam2_01317, partial [Chlamydiae bacterium]|nr:hypothetical protein [Chlamydiota bacterium]